MTKTSKSTRLGRSRNCEYSLNISASIGDSLIIQALRWVSVFSMPDLIADRFSKEGRKLLIKVTHSFVVLSFSISVALNVCASPRLLVTFRFLQHLFVADSVEGCAVQALGAHCEILDHRNAPSEEIVLLQSAVNLSEIQMEYTL